MLDMNIYKFKTTINCGGCVAKVTPALNELAGEKNWKVDLQDPDKTLTVTSENATETTIANALQGAGYKVKSS
jgi:copper chaperone CopZ